MKQWEQFLQAQVEALGAEAIEKWTKSLRVVDFDAGNLYLEASDSFQLNWFEEHLRPRIVRYFKNNNGRPIKVHLSLPQPPKKKEWKPVLNLVSDPLEARCTFENYFPGRNQTHLTLLKEAIEKGGYNPIYLQGPEGCGKTHLLMASAHHLKHKKCFYVKTDTLTHHIVAAIRSGGMKKLRQLYRDHDVLLLDDVHELAHRSATQEEFFHTFNALHVAGKQIILAGPTAPSKLDGIEPRLTSRFEWGLVLPFQPLNAAEQKELINDLPEDIRSFLSTAFHSVKLLQVAARMVKKEMTLAQVQNTVAGLLGEQKKNALTPEAIVKAVAEVFEIRPSDILSRSQNQECSLPRQIAMYVCRSQLKLPFLKIGEVFSRDHSTVMTSVKGVEKKLGEQDDAVLSAVNEIKSKFKF